ncbi:MAG: hypothetical protein M1829_001146 [Trizodia sp. TS-e1964]|nr:MAG: hypothetical protein M1829_001146 [Trizodia sp. TS-e1964]
MVRVWYWSRVDLNGLLPDALPAIPDPLDEGISSSIIACFFLPHILQATNAIPPRRIAPPTPTTIPIISRFCPSSRPELPEPFPLFARLIVLIAVLVATGTTELVVKTLDIVLLPLIVITVVTISWVALETEIDVTVELSAEDVAVEVGGVEVVGAGVEVLEAEELVGVDLEVDVCDEEEEVEVDVLAEGEGVVDVELVELVLRVEDEDEVEVVVGGVLLVEVRPPLLVDTESSLDCVEIWRL